MKIIIHLTTAALIVGVGGTPARAEDLQTCSLTLKGHRFAPKGIHVPTASPSSSASRISTTPPTSSR